MARQQDSYAQRSALEVMIEWRGTVMEVAHLTTGAFTIGEGGDFDFADPSIPAGQVWTVADIDGDRVRAVIPPGVAGWTCFGAEVAPVEPSDRFQAVSLERDARARLEIGELVVHCARVPKAVIDNMPGSRLVDADTKRGIGGAAILHAVFIVAALALPLDAATLTSDAFDPNDRFVEMVFAPDKPMRDPFEALRGQGDEGDKGDDAAPSDEPPTENAGGAPAPKADRKFEPKTRAVARAEAKAAAEDAKAALNGELSTIFNDRGPLSDRALVAMNGMFDRVDGEGVGMGGEMPGAPGRGPGTGPGQSVGINGTYATCTNCDGPGGSYDRGEARPGRRIPKTPPQVVPLDPRVEGGITKDMIRRVIRRNRSQYRFCYERALKTKRDLAGKVVVKFVIGPNGAVIAARAEQDEVGAGVAECVVGKVRRWQFPAPVGGGIVNVRYPFLFKSSG